MYDMFDVQAGRAEVQQQAEPQIDRLQKIGASHAS